ncbi:hypothetical protein ACQ4WX_06600 [Streptomyces lasalocidi]
MSAEELTDRIQKAIANPITHDDGFDIHEALREILSSVGLHPTDSGGKITFIGSDPIVPSIMRLGAVPALGMTAKSVALAALWRHRGGEGQDITMDLRKAPHRLCPFYDKKWELLNGYPGGTPSDPANPLGFDFYQARDGRWVMPLNPYPKIKNSVYKLLRTWPDKQAVADAVAQWNAADLERGSASRPVWSCRCCAPPRSSCGNRRTSTSRGNRSSGSRRSATARPNPSPAPPTSRSPAYAPWAWATSSRARESAVTSPSTAPTC